MFIATSITIPNNIKLVIKEMFVEEKTLDIALGRKYSYQKIKEHIYQDFKNSQI